MSEFHFSNIASYRTTHTQRQLDKRLCGISAIRLTGRFVREKGMERVERLLDPRSLAMRSIRFLQEHKRQSIGRNHSCPCNSGKRFKRCHMALKAA